MSERILDVLKAKLLGDLSADEMSSAVNLAQSILRADYYTDVRRLGESVLDAIKSGEVTDADSLRERVEQECDGTQRVIYTYQAKCGLLASDNEDAWEEVGDSAGLTPEGRMYYALRADVFEWLDSEGYGSDWDGPKDETDDEDEDSVNA